VLALVATVGVATWSHTRNAAGDGPVVEITAPADGFKLRQGRKAPVRVHVAAGSHPLRDWRVQLIEAYGTGHELARGNQPIVDRNVAELSADALGAGARYAVELHATDTAGTEATARTAFLIPDPQYALIPLEAGNMTTQTEGGLAIDGSGTLVAMGGNQLGDIWLLDTLANRVQYLQIPLSNTDGFRLSADGHRLVFAGSSPFRLGILSLDSLEISRGPQNVSLFLTTDRSGQRVAVQAVDPDTNTLQYYFFNDATGEVRQLTNDPQAIDWNGACPRIVGTTPMISGDGDTVAFITSAGLGLVPPEPTGCRIFAYDVPNATLRHVRTLPATTGIDIPAISDDGRWLSFTVRHQTPPLVRRDYPALLDVKTGELTDPVGGITDFPSGDSVIAGDSSAIVISSHDDLDARVGNADHTLELFAYDRVSGRFTQMTETTGGVALFSLASGGCSPYQPQVSTNAGAAVFFFAIGSGELCRLDGPQRNEADGFTFRRVRAVRKRPGNHPPVFARIQTIRVRAGDDLTVDFSATDPDNDVVVFFAQEAETTDIPAGSGIIDHRNGTATFTWSTKLDEVGVHRLRVGAFDAGGGEMVQDVTIAVCSRIVHDGNLSGTLRALFDSDLPALCRDADLNHDGALTVADMVGALKR